MVYIYANQVCYERIIPYLDYREIEYDYDGEILDLYLPLVGLDMQVIYQYLEISHIEDDEDEEYLDEEEQEESSVEIEIIQLMIKPKKVIECKVDKNAILHLALSGEEVREGMILKKTLSSGEKYFFLVGVTGGAEECEMYEVRQNVECGYKKLSYTVTGDLEVFDEELSGDGAVDLQVTYVEDYFADYTFCGYAKFEYFVKIQEALLEKKFATNVFPVREYPYDFMQKDKIFEMAFSNLPKVRYHSENHVEAIVKFLSKMSFTKVSNQFVIILLLAISTKNTDIVDLVKILKQEYKSIDERKVFRTILADYDEFLSNTFYNYRDLKYISVNYFISFIVENY